MMTRTDASELFAAIKAGDEVAVRRLVEADPGLVNEREDGVTPLLTAYYYRQSDVAEWLRRARAPRDVFEAAAAGDAERVREFVARDQSLANAYAEDGFHPLGLAAFFKRPEAVRFLLAAGADPSAPARNPMKVTALHSAVANGGHLGGRARSRKGHGASQATRREGQTGSRYLVTSRSGMIRRCCELPPRSR
jgi:ankyrin repeat protein